MIYLVDTIGETAAPGREFLQTIYSDLFAESSEDRCSDLRCNHITAAKSKREVRKSRLPRLYLTAPNLPKLSADVPGISRSHWSPSYQLQNPDDTTDVLPFTSATPSTSTTNTDRAPEPSLPSSSIVSISVVATPIPSTTANNSATPTTINLTTANASDVGSVHICPHCDCTFTSHIGLVGHFRIHRTETGKPVPGARTYTRRIPSTVFTGPAYSFTA
nr:unnamed protein product [Spirometra erinaceieuropaei]